MSEHDQLNSEQQRAQSLVRGTEYPRASDAFRARLKDEFVSGSIRPSVRVVSPRPWYRRGVTRWSAPLAAAAALVLLLWYGGQSPQWRVVGGHGQARIDGRLVSLDDPPALGSLRAGTHVEVIDGSQLQLCQARSVLIEVAAHGELVVPGSPGRWFGSARSGSVERGVVRIVTGPGFTGQELTMETRDGQVEVMGTTFTLMCTEQSTCVCVLEGDVLVADAHGGRDLVQGGHRKTMFRDGGPELGDMHENERIELGRLQQVAVNLLAP